MSLFNAMRKSGMDFLQRDSSSSVSRWARVNAESGTRVILNIEKVHYALYKPGETFVIVMENGMSISLDGPTDEEAAKLFALIEKRIDS